MARVWGSVQGAVLWRGRSQECILAAKSELSEVSKECRLMIMGELIGCLRNIRILLGDRSQVYCESLLGVIS